MTENTEVTAGSGAVIRTMAISLWVVVSCLLAYGIGQTVIKASALFG